MKKTSKILVAILTLALLLGVVVVSAFATNENEDFAVRVSIDGNVEDVADFAAAYAKAEAAAPGAEVIITLGCDQTIAAGPVYKFARKGKTVIDLNGYAMEVSAMSSELVRLNAQYRNGGSGFWSADIKSEFYATVDGEDVYFLMGGALTHELGADGVANTDDDTLTLKYYGATTAITYEATIKKDGTFTAQYTTSGAAVAEDKCTDVRNIKSVLGLSYDIIYGVKNTQAPVTYGGFSVVESGAYVEFIGNGGKIYTATGINGSLFSVLAG